MNDNFIESIDYKKYTINVFYDDNCESPNDWGNDEVFLVGYHRDFWIDLNKKISKELAIAIAEKDKDYSYEVEEYLKKYHVFELEAYIHSGVNLSLSYEGNYPDRRWDVSQLGLVFVLKKVYKTEEKAIEAAISLIETWNQYLSGDVYGFDIEDSKGEIIDSCLGYYGKKGREEMIKEAKLVINSEIQKKIKDHCKKLKIQIKHKVPYEKRSKLEVSL